MPVTKYFPRVWSSPKQKEQIFFKCDPALQRPLRVGCICPPPPPPPPPKQLYITTVAGNGTAGYSGDDGPAISAQLNYPRGVYVDSSGNIYIADRSNHRIRKVDTAGTITTIAGNGTIGFSGDGGLATDAQLNFPTGVCVDSLGNVYILNPTNGIQKIDNQTKIITTMFQPGTSGVISVCVDSDRNVYFYYSIDKTIQKIDITGTITRFAGGNGSGNGGDGGPAINAQFGLVNGLAVDSAGNMYIADTTYGRIRKIDKTTGIITAYANNVANANFICVDLSGNLYVSNTSRSGTVRKIDTNKVITTIAGGSGYIYNRDNILASTANLYHPQGVAVDASGNVYIADESNQRIRKLYYA